MQNHSDLALARRLERAEGHAGAKFVEARAKVFPAVGATWIEVAGAYAMFDGVSSPVTQTFGLGLFDTVTDAELDRIERFFADRGAPVFHEVSPLAGVALAAQLAERGYRPVEFTSVMHRSLAQEVDSAPLRNPGLQVRLVGEKDRRVWAETAARGWSEFAEYSDLMEELGQINPHREDGVSFLAELDGRPIAAAVLCVNAGVGLLAGACTIPEGRKQGAQLALLESRLRYAAEHSCDLAMICAAPGSPSQRNAERHGFRIAYTRIKWGRPA